MPPEQGPRPAVGPLLAGYAFSPAPEAPEMLRADSEEGGEAGGVPEMLRRDEAETSQEAANAPPNKAEAEAPRGPGPWAEEAGGFVSPVPEMLRAEPIPAGRVERCTEAARIGLRSLGPALQEQLAELTEPSVLRAFVVVLLAWALLQMTPAGPWADVVLLLTAGYSTIKEIAVAAEDLGAWVTIASTTSEEEGLQRAGRHFAAALVRIGVQTILAILALRSFKQLRYKVGREPGRFGGGAGEGAAAAGEEGAATGPRPARPAVAPRRVPVGPLQRVPVGQLARAGVITAAAAPGLAGAVPPLPKIPEPPWGALLAGGLLVVGTVVTIGVMVSRR